MPAAHPGGAAIYRTLRKPEYYTAACLRLRGERVFAGATVPFTISLKDVPALMTASIALSRGEALFARRLVLPLPEVFMCILTRNIERVARLPR